jgi:preprotein translocase subunit Sec63
MITRCRTTEGKVSAVFPVGHENEFIGHKLRFSDHRVFVQAQKLMVEIARQDVSGYHRSTGYVETKERIPSRSMATLFAAMDERRVPKTSMAKHEQTRLVAPSLSLATLEVKSLEHNETNDVKLLARIYDRRPIT